jgi:hypothetical protein
VKNAHWKTNYQKKSPSMMRAVLFWLADFLFTKGEAVELVSSIRTVARSVANKGTKMLVMAACC